MAGERHSEKCTRKEAVEFRNKVKTFLNKEKLPYVKLLALCCYDGQIKVFTGDTISKMRIRQGRKLLAFKKPDGSYVGSPEEILHLKKTGGSHLYLRTSEPIIKKEYLPVYRVDNWEEEKQYLIEKLSRKN